MQGHDDTNCDPRQSTVNGGLFESLRDASEGSASGNRDVFPVVGIGASAGGLEAATDLVGNLSPATGMAFVLVQHLDPHHESILAELLARHTSMQVTQARQGTAVRPNCIYVIPPNAQMAIREGVLLLTARPESRGPHLPIDHFLCSLADDRKSLAVGIILSGTASDGAIGLKAIKSEGGITFAQDRSARFDSMPRNAVAAGAVDFVLPAAGIAREIGTIAQHSHLEAARANDLVEDGAPLQQILSMLRASTNVDFIHYKTPTIQRRLSRRLALHNMERLDTYVALLQNKPDELHALFDDLLINVTEFFRESKTFEALVRIVFPEILKRKGETPIRIWAPGCSSGEEVYSIAICLTEYLEANNASTPIQIFGTDISERSIHTARNARYPEGISASVSPERLQRFFTKFESEYQVARSIRDLCVFSRHDVSKDPPLSRMDLISCRNLLIYLGPVLQKRVMAIFSYSLTPSGYLVLGSSESPGSLSDHFVTVDREHKIYKRNLQLSQPPFELPGSIQTRLNALSSQVPPSTPDSSTALDRKADRLLSSEYAPGGFLVNAEYRVVKFRGAVGPWLAPASGDATLDVLKLIQQDLAFPLRVALDEASRTRASIRREFLPTKRGNSVEQVNLIVRPIADQDSKQHFLILFEPASNNIERLEMPLKNTDSPRDDGSRISDPVGELQSTRAYMQGLIEELRSANEEAQSSNEELQSTNEELQTAKEELQSTNEELTTINDEMRGRNVELNQLNNDLMNLLSSMKVPIVMLNSELRIRRFTPKAEKVLNLIPTDVGRPISDLKPRVNVPDLEHLLTTVVRTLEPLEKEVQDQDGYWYSLRIQPYRTADKRVDGAVLQLLDIDQLKRTLENVVHARDYAEAILSTVREPLVVLDHELRIQTANRSFFETFQLSGDETLNRVFYEVGKGQWNIPKVHQMLEAILRNDETSFQDVEIEHDFERIGSRTFELNARRVDRDGRPGLLLLALEDISDRKKAAEARYRRLFETAKDGIFILDGDTGEVTDINPFATDLLGIRREDILGKEFWSLEPFAGFREGPPAMERVQAGETVRFPETSLTREDGRIIISEIVANMYNEGEKRVVQFNIRDITARKRFDQQLQETARLESLGVLAGGIAHDFNNLLTGIMGNASLALTHAPPGSPYQAELKEVVQASHRAAGLTRQLLAYAGKGRFIVRPVNLSELVKDITSLIRTSVSKTVELALNLDDHLPQFDADASQLQQVVMNLVINAAEAIGENRGGTVRITTKREQLEPDYIHRYVQTGELSPGPFVCLEVTDNGCGMDEATLTKIFDPFFTTKFTGRGLGLAAVQGIIHGHNGAILVNSTPGRGTTFKVLFPMKKSSSAPPAQEQPLRDLRGTGTILLVDDEDMILRLAAPMLTQYGYKVLTAVNGELAVQMVRENGAINLVILDLTMPVMGGEEAFARIRKIRPDLPVILSSGYDQTQAASRFSEKDLAGFVQKPYTIENLLGTVKTALQ